MGRVLLRKVECCIQGLKHLKRPVKRVALCISSILFNSGSLGHMLGHLEVGSGTHVPTGKLSLLASAGFYLFVH